MQSRYKHFFLTVIGYFAGNVFTKLVSFFLLPLYTKLIDPEIFGIYGVNMTIVQLVVAIVYLAVWNAVFRFAAEADTDEGRYEIISAGFPVMWLSSFVCTAVLVFINFFWNLSTPFLVCIYAIANAFQYFYGYIARSMKDNRIFIISGCINSTVNILLNVVGIAYLHNGIETLYYSYIIGTVIQVIIIECKFHALLHFKIKYVQKTRLKKMMKFGIPLALNAVMQWLLTGLTQVMIAHKLGTYYNGLFSVAMKFATVTALVSNVFEYAWLELAYDIAKNRNSAEYYKKTSNMLFIVLIFGTSVLMLLIKLIFPYFIDESYHECLSVIPHMVLFACTNSFASFNASIFMSYKDVPVLTISSLVAGGINFILLLLLIPAWKFQGALISLAAASVSMMMIRSIALHKKYGISIETFTMFYIIMIPICVIIFYTTDNFIIDIAVVFICVVLFIFSVCFFYRKYMAVKE